MQIFQTLAGYSLGFADNVRRAMSKKHFDEIERERESFLYGDAKRNIQGCIANGISKEVANTLFDQMTEFAKYAFNKSHAAAYSMISYQTAYLKYHYPVEYMSAVMTHEKNEKMSSLIYDCKQMGIQVLPIDINYSYDSFVPENGNIRYGLSMMKSMGSFGKTIVEERLKNGFYQSLQDFIERTDPSKSVLEGLALSGGFDSFYPSKRIALSSGITDFKQLIKDKIKKEKQYQTNPNEILKEAIDSLQQSIQYFSYHFPDDNELEALNNEHSYLGAYVSKHPLDSFHAVFQNVMTVSNFEEGYHKLAGLITNLRFVKKKDNGADMAFFLLEDISGSVEVCVFSKVFHNLKPYLKEGNIVYVEGNCIIEYVDEETENYKVFASQMSICHAFQENILLSIDNQQVMKGNIPLQNYLKQFFNEKGVPFVVYNIETDEAISGKTLLSKKLLEKDIPFEGIHACLQKIKS